MFIHTLRIICTDVNRNRNAGTPRLHFTIISIQCAKTPTNMSLALGSDKNTFWLLTRKRSCRKSNVVANHLEAHWPGCFLSWINKEFGKTFFFYQPFDTFHPVLTTEFCVFREMWKPLSNSSAVEKISQSSGPPQSWSKGWLLPPRLLGWICHITIIYLCLQYEYSIF